MEKRQISIPNSIQKLITCGIEAIKPRKIILFGSRVRGEARDNSDFDLAFEFDPSKATAWSRFVTNWDGKYTTLFHVDFVDLGHCSNELKKEILDTGVLLYEDHPTARELQ